MLNNKFFYSEKKQALSYLVYIMSQHSVKGHSLYFITSNVFFSWKYLVCKISANY